ncbi:MAG: M56 family metallopeptidase [Planctomycetaceae bacterium]
MSWLPETIQERLVLVLAHFVWQGAAVAALLAMLVALLRLKRPHARYASSLLAFVLMSACPVVTWFVVPGVRCDPDAGCPNTALHQPREQSVEPLDIEVSPTVQATVETFDPVMLRPDEAVAAERDQSSIPIVAETTIDGGLRQAAALQGDTSWLDALRPFEPWIVGVWLCGVGVLSLRLLLGAIGLWRWRRAVELLPESLVPLVERLCAALSLTPPRVRVCHRVAEAVAVGLFKPMILLPAAWLTELPPDMLEAVLAHELAHIRRLDLWVNLLQRLVETMLFYHPAVWWLSRRLRIEREHCCDEFAVTVTNDRVRYAETLEHVARLIQARAGRDKKTPALSVAMSGREGVLLHRIRQLLGATSPPRGGSVWLAGAVTLGLVLTIALGMFVTSQAEVESPKADRNAEAPVVAVADFKTLLDELSIGTNHVDDEVAPRGLAAKTVRGELLAADGRPVPNAKIVLLRGEGYWNELYRSNLAITDSAGKFVVRGEVEMCHLAIEVGSIVWAMDLSLNESDVVVRLPKLIEVTLKLDRQVELEEQRIELHSMDRVEGQVFLMRRVPGTIDSSGVAKVSVPAGRYLAIGSKRLNPDDAKPLWGWCALGEVTVDAKQTPETLVRRLTGSRISGQVKNLEELLKNANADYAEVSVSVAVERHGEWQEFTFDSVLCEADGSFRLGPVPVGRARVRVDVRDRPGQERPFGERSRFLQQRLTLSRRLEVVELPASVEELSVADHVAAILDSEWPMNVSWSHTDVQVASLALLPESVEVTRELIRLMNDPQTPDNWQYVVIEALGRMKPISAEAKSALLAGAKNPKLRRRGSMLHALGNMRADAADLIDEIVTFKDSPDMGLRGSALRALGDIGKSLPNVPASVGDALIAALDDPVIHIRKDVAGSLAMQKAAQAVPALRSHLRSDPNGSVRAVCAWAIFHITDEVDEAVPVLIELLDSDDHKARMEAAIYLGFFDARAKAAIPALEANATFTGKPPFNNSRETRRYQLTSAAQSAIRKIAGTENKEVAPPKPATGNQNAEQKPVTYKCRVITSGTKTPIVGATVVFKRTLLGDPRYPNEHNRLLEKTTHVTDADGWYEVTIPPEQLAERYLYLELDVSHSEHPSKNGFGYAMSMIRKNEPAGGRPFFETTELIPGRAVTGTVVKPDGQPAASVKIIGYWLTRPRTSDSGSFFQSQTDADGKFRVVAPATGEAAFWLQPEEACPVGIVVPPDRGDLGTLTLKSGPRRSGQVIDADGRAVAGMLVRIEREGSESPDIDRFNGQSGAVSGYQREALTDADGRFVMPPVDAGKYELRVSTNRRSTELPPTFNGVFLVPSVTFDAESKPLEVRAVPSVEIRVRNIDGKGQPKRGFGFNVFGEIEDRVFFGHSTRPEDGHTVARVPRGLRKARIRFTDNEHGSFRVRRKPGAPLEHIDRLTFSSIDDDIEGIEVVRYTAPIVLVKAVDAANQPVADFNPQVRYATSPKDADGEFVSGVAGDVDFEHQADGRWRTKQLLPDEDITVTVIKDGWSAEPQRLRMAEGAERELVFVMKPVGKARAGRGSPGPALDPTAGLPNSDDETNPPNNAHGDLRSNPAAGAGDARRAQSQPTAPIEPTDEQLQAATSAFQALGGMRTNWSHLGKYAFRPTKGGRSPASFTDEEVRKIPNLPFSFSLNLHGTLITSKGLAELAKLDNLTGLALPGRLTTDAGLKELTRFKNLKRINFSEGSQITEAGLKELANLQDLTELDLPRTPLTNSWLRELTKLENLSVLKPAEGVTDAELKEIAKLKHLTKLSLSNHQMTDAGLKELAKLQELTELELGSEKRLTDVGIKAVASLPKLTKLAIANAQLSNASLKEIAKLKHLKWLEIPHSPITSAGLKDIGSLNKLEYLNLSGTNVEDAGFDELARLTNLRTLVLSSTETSEAALKKLGPLERLEELYVDGTRLSDDGLKEIVKFPRLNRLNISGTNVSGTGLKELAKLEHLNALILGGGRYGRPANPPRDIASLKQLKALYIRDLNLTDDTMKEIGSLENLSTLRIDVDISEGAVAQIASLKNLEKLYIRGRVVTDADIKHLARLRKLKELALFYCTLTAAGERELRLALPTCEFDFHEIVRPVQPTVKTEPPKGLEFLKPYPKLHGLSLDMTEPQFLEIVKQQELKTRKTVEGEKVTHHIALGDGHTLIVMFDKDAKCSGIQRVRGEEAEAKGEAVAVPTTAELEKLIQAKGRELFFGRMELAQEFEMLWPTKDQKHEKVTSKGTVRSTTPTENRSSR